MEKWRENIRRVTPYVPGEQPAKKNIIKLNTNENPYPPSPSVARALKELEAERLRLYPDPACKVLVEALAQYHGLSREQVFVGVGSDDVLAMAFLAFFNSGKPVLFPDITYSFYKVWAGLFHIPFRTPALDGDFCICAGDYRGENGGVVFPNPNAPTGILEPLSFVEEILEANQDVIVIVDEAYIDFGGESAVSLLPKYDNLLVVRTFSKSRSMAGMRIGYALGSRALVRALNDVKYSYNSYTMSQAALELGAAAVGDEAYFRETVGKIMATRERTKERLAALGFEVLPSAANFLFASHPSVKAELLFRKLREQGIYVRYFDSPRICDYLRITIGLDGEMDQLCRALESCIKDGKG